MEILKLDHVSKRFGSQMVIQDLSFSVPEHTIYGFIGQNGAGKTTTMKMILGLLQSDQGEIYVHGERVSFGENPANRFIGYLPDVPEFYDFMTCEEYLNLCADITGISHNDKRERIHEVLKLVHLDTNKKRIHGFSRGMKQRLGIAQALLHKPALLICDEPTSALDPIGRKEILDILLSVKETTTVLFSTHILSDVERICDEIGVLHHGSLVMQGTMDEIRRSRKSEGFEIEFSDVGDANKFFTLYTGGEWMDAHQIFYPNKTKDEMGDIFSILAQHRFQPQRIEMREPSLESLFVEVVGE